MAPFQVELHAANYANNYQLHKTRASIQVTTSSNLLLKREVQSQNFRYISSVLKRSVFTYRLKYTQSKQRSLLRCHRHIQSLIVSSSSVFCPKAGPSLQAEKPMLQFCRRQVFQRKLRNQGCSFTRDLIGAVASRCFPHPTFFTI